jgi:predicted nucleotide-binding protein
MEAYLTNLLAQQLVEVVRAAAGPNFDTAVTSTARGGTDGYLASESPNTQVIQPAPSQESVIVQSLAILERQPRIFIGSSAEGLQIAEELQVCLQYDAEPTIWSQGIFGLASGTLETLDEQVGHFDFAALILTPDDMLIKRSDGKPSARDNVLFELGLFMGKLGRLRTFIVHPRGTEMHMPSDLSGVTTATYDPGRGDGNVNAALGPVATQIKRAIRDQRAR